MRVEKSTFPHAILNGGDGVQWSTTLKVEA